jgi:heterodisulfide reductase subunit B2
MAVTTINTLAEQIEQACGENVYACFQCKKCTAGCPVVEHFDIAPHQMLRAMQFGQRDAVLNSRTLWLCASCEACYTRCPQAVNFPRIIDALRMMAADEGIKPAVRAVPDFYAAALRGIKLFGRMYEPGLMAEMYLRSLLAGELDIKDVLKNDMPMAATLLKMGKLKILPPLSKSAKHGKKQGDARISIGYYPGCSLHSTGLEFDISTRAVADKLSLELVEPDGWVCCGTTPAHSTDHVMATMLPARSLQKVEQSGQSSVTVPCPSCFVRLKTAVHDMAAEPELQQEVEKATGYVPSPDLEVEHLLTTLARRVGAEAISEAAVRSLNGLKAVCYYGCVITRPPDITGAKVYEYPTEMDELLRAMGTDVLDWSYKTECCGGSLGISQLPISLEMSSKVLENAREVGAEAIIVACPLCHVNLDSRRKQINEQSGESYDMPVIYFTQLMGLAFGMEPEEVGLEKHFVTTEALLREKHLWETS